MARRIRKVSSIFFFLLLQLSLSWVTSYVGTPQRRGRLTLPHIIQGGMGVRISSWKLAREVAKTGEMGVISGTAMDVIFVRTLQDGDPGGSFRRALATFPDQDMVERAMKKYFIEGGKDPMKPYRSIPMWDFQPSQHLLEAAVLGNYCEVWLAKHDDDGSLIDGVVGINRLTKIALPTIASLYGAMLADVDYVLMGAGIPMNIPGILDNLSESKGCELAIDVSGSDDEHAIKFSPSEFWETAGNPELGSMTLKRPAFLPIVSSVVLAQSLLKRANGKGPNNGIDGFVIELNPAGGHNAPPRGFKYNPNDHHGLNDKGEPIYGPKDDVDLLKFAKSANGLPFWLAGGYASADKLCDVLDVGGAGIQVGSAFALAKESGMDATTRQKICNTIATQDLEVITDPACSPTGFPFKVLQLEDTLANEDNYNARPRACNLGYLRMPYVMPNGKIGYRCPSGPVEDWVAKGGNVEDTIGRKCLCNALCADAGFPQVRRFKDEDGKERLYVEKSLITAGDDVNKCRHLLSKDEDGNWNYSAKDVVEYLTSALEERNHHHGLEEDTSHMKILHEIAI